MSGSTDPDSNNLRSVDVPLLQQPLDCHTSLSVPVFRILFYVSPLGIACRYSDVDDPKEIYLN